MATRLDGVAATVGSRRFRRSGRRLADAAARDCLDRAGVDADDVDLLINAGLYHDRLLGEPALAALIQEDIDANPEDVDVGGGRGTFSFDLANGACGMLTALQVADGFLSSGTIRHALVVASDADPGHRLAPRFPYAPAAAAILAGWSDGDGGISGFRFATRDGGDVSAVVSGGREGRSHLRIVEDPTFLRDAAGLAAEVAEQTLAATDLSAEDVEVVANPLRPAFLEELATRLGVPVDRVLRLPGREDVHTAALGVGLDAAMADGHGDRPRTLLLVSAGAGLTAGAALLRLPVTVRPRRTT